MQPASAFQPGTCDCRACGTRIPHDEPVLTNFRRCYYCGRFNPAGINWRSIMIPAALIAGMTALTAWWGNALL